jgi:hypothetical protein
LSKEIEEEEEEEGLGAESDDRSIESTKEWDAESIAYHHLCSLSSVNNITSASFSPKSQFYWFFNFFFLIYEKNLVFFSSCFLFFSC